jgi:hypothetical protein
VDAVKPFRRSVQRQEDRIEIAMGFLDGTQRQPKGRVRSGRS